MPHCARFAIINRKFGKSRPKAAVAATNVKHLKRRSTVEGKAVAMGTRQGRRKTLNPVKTGLNIHERPVRKKKKTPKYETYERDRGVVSLPKESAPEVETNVLLALGLTPVKNGLNRMHVADEEAVKTEKPSHAEAETVSADTPKKGVAVAVAASTTVDENCSGVGDGAEAEAKPPISPKLNGVCDSAGDGSRSKNGSRRCNKEDASSVTESTEATSNTVSDTLPLKVKDEEEQPVESSEPQDLTVTCTSSVDPTPKHFPAAKYISISVEQCQTTPPAVNHHAEEQKRPRPVSGRKRSTKSSDSDENGYKRSRCDDRESAVSDFVEKASGSGLEELTRHAEVLQQEIHGLSALARSKELEWNDVIRMKKLKEEMYLRLIRRKQLMLLTIGAGTRPPEGANWDFALENRMSEFFTSDEVSLNRVNKQPRIPSNLTITKSQSGASQQLQRFLLHPQRQEQMHHQHFQQGPRQSLKIPKTGRAPFPILPKPSQLQEQMPPGGLGRQTGSQGPIVDVKSIIADYRQSHPESIPRRGRRMKGAVADNMVSSSRGVLSMSSLALGSGSQVRTVGSTSGPEESSRPSSADSSRSEAVSFKDVLVQFAKMTNPPKPPPPYPEVTLHPVLPGTSQSPPPHSSLLHGILTKTGTPATGASGGNKPTTFSPTLARLLTTPDRPSTTTTITTAVRGAAGTSSSSSTGPVSISELLSTSRKRNELTITPVSNTQPAKLKDEAVSGSQEEDPDDTDRLVIDEGYEGEARHEDTENDPPDVVPECQGCHLKPAQFVCAGCGNQWYCSRNCQVAAWDEHSEVCSG